jgi:HK97 family phage portal protein
LKIKDNRENDNNDLADHPVLRIFNRNQDGLMTAFDLKKYLITSTLLRGNGYAYIHRAADGVTPVMITYLEPSDVTVYYDKYRDLLWYSSPIIKNNKKIDPDDMIHLKVFSYNGVEGVSVIGLANRTINTAQNAEIAANSFFKKGCTQKGILSPQASLQGQQAEQIKSTWDENTSGIHVLRTPMTFTPLTLNSADAQLLQSREYSVEEICRWFHVPAALLTNSKGTFSSLEMLQQMFYANCLSGHIAMIECEFNKKLLRPSESYYSIYLDTNELLRAIKKDSANYYQVLVTSGILTPNEARADLGFSPVEGGDELRIAYSDAQQNSLNNNNTEEPKEEDKQE